MFPLLERTVAMFLRRARHLLHLGFVLTSFLGVGGVSAQVPGGLLHRPADLPALREEQLRAPVASVVRIESRAVENAPSSQTLGRRRTGSGVLLSDRWVLSIGYLLIETEGVDVITPAGRRIPGSLAGYDHATGLALVHTVLPVDGTPVRLGDSDQIALQQRVLTLGAGEDEATELFVVSRRPFAAPWEYLLEEPLITWPPVNNWSGSALLTEDGELIGIGSLVVGQSAVELSGLSGNLFVPVNLLKPILEDLKTQGRRRGPVQPWFGISTEARGGRLILTRVAADSPAAAAGLERGDAVLAVDGWPVTSLEGFYRKLWLQGPAGTEVVLQVERPGSGTRDVLLRSMDRSDILRRPSGV